MFVVACNFWNAEPGYFHCLTDGANRRSFRIIRQHKHAGKEKLEKKEVIDKSTKVYVHIFQRQYSV
jgi:hypothetical protein